MIDGVIKYHVQHRNAPTPPFTNFTTMEALRSRLFTLGLIGETADGIGYGNISSRDGDQAFFITASQTGKLPRLKPTDYAHVHDYNISAFTVYSTGLHQASSEALSHAMIYQIDPAIQAVIHVHSAPLWQMMKAMHADQSGALATHAEYGTVAMAKEIAALYAHTDPFAHNALVMLGHEDGLMTFGTSAQDAERSLYRLIGQCLRSQS